MNLLGVDESQRRPKQISVRELYFRKLDWTFELANFEAVGRALGMANGFLDFACLRIKVFVFPMPKYCYAL
jgi:hypothetical protein